MSGQYEGVEVDARHCLLGREAVLEQRLDEDVLVVEQQHNDRRDETVEKCGLLAGLNGVQSAR
jgi:hypothetical protein